MATSELRPAVERSRRLQRFTESRLFYPLLLFFIIVGFYWKLTLTKQYDWVWGPDLAEQVLPWFEEEARQMQHSELPLWDPRMWCGQPMMGQAQPGAAYPLNWILFLIPRSGGHIPILALQWYFIVIHAMAAIFCYWLCRDLGRSRFASLLAGLVFALASYIGTTDWPQMVNGAVWAPLVFLFLLRAVRGYRPMVSAAICGACLGTAWLSGHHQVPLYISLTMCLTWLYFILRDSRIDWQMVKLAAIAMIFTGMVGALQILSGREYGLLARRWAGADEPLRWNEAVPYYVHGQYAMTPTSLLGIIFPGLAAHSDPFIGVVAFSLVLLAVALCWKSPMVKLFGAIALGAIVYSLGPNSIFHGFLYAVVPMLEKARVPSMATIIWETGAAVLVAFGADAFAPERHSLWTRRIVLGILAFGGAVYLIIVGVLFANKGAWQWEDRVSITALVTVLLACLLYAWRSGNLTGRQAAVLLTMLMLFELGNDSAYSFPHRTDKDRGRYIEMVRGNKDLAQFLSEQPGTFRVGMPDSDKIVDNWGNYHGFDIVKGLAAGVTSNMLELEWHTWQTKRLLGVRYSIAEKPPLDDARDLFAGSSGLHVYEDQNAFPRAWTVHRIEQVQGPAVVRQTINDHLDDLHWKALMFSKPPAVAECPGSDDVSITRYMGERVELQARMACDGMVVLSDTYFPGWVAKVDGKKSPIYEVDSALRGVVVPAGTHKLVMSFRPSSIYLGGVLTFLGWFTAIGLGVFGPGRRR